MQEHFIPQDISNYKFHLIGELDLQQFLEILAGVVIGVIIYKLGLPGFITWPLVLISVGLGLVAAFVPIADQPLSHWAKVFFHLLSAPTKFYWRKEIIIPAYFTYELHDEYQNALATQDTFNSTTVKTHRALDYFTSLDQKNNQVDDNLEVFSPKKIQAAMSQFNFNSSQEKVSSVPSLPRKKISRRPLIQEGQSLRIRPIITPSQKNIDSFITTALSRPIKLVTKIASLDEKTIGWPQAKLANQQKTEVKSQASALPSIEPTTASSLPTKAVVFQAPLNSNLSVNKITPSSLLEEQSFNSSVQINEKNFLLKGKIVNSNNQPIPETILSLKDNHDNFKFLLHSDENGNFISNQPLSPGEYRLSAQKELFTFPNLTINITNQGIPPILLKAN